MLKAKGYTHKKIAEVLGVTHQNVSYLFTVKKDLKASQLFLLLNLLDENEFRQIFKISANNISSENSELDKERIIKYKNIALKRTEELLDLHKQEVSRLKSELASKDKKIEELQAKMQKMEELLKNIRAKQD